MSSTTSVSALTDSTTSPTSLIDLDQRCWQQLAQSASADKASDGGFRYMIMATCTSHGADARIVVLRHVDAAHKYVWFHTDARTEKVLQLEAFPQAKLLFWDDKQQVQLRLTVETRLHTDDYLADEQWEKLHDGSIRSYLSECMPGSEQAAPYPGFPEHVSQGELTPGDRAFGRQNFAAIECRVLCMEYLKLSKEGQTRARFQYEPVSKMSWLAP
jgi:general stress protein 26